MLVYNDISEQDIWNYWKTLFPEVKSDKELMEIIGGSDNFKFENIKKIWEENTTENTEFYTWLTEQDDSICNRFEWFSFIYDEPMNNIFTPLFMFNIDKIIDLKEDIYNNGLFFNPACIFESLVKEICMRLREVTIRVFITEINVAKTYGLLKGKESTDRYRYYTDAIWTQKDYIYKFYSEYKELLEIQLITFDNTYNSITEMILRINKNYNDIVKLTKCNEQELKISEIQMGLGDSHCAGRTVSLIAFANGQKVIYKPRSLRAEIGFSSYSEMLNKGMDLGDKSLYLIKAITYKDYGFIEYITQKECDKEEQLERYYYRSGVLMAMLHSLNAKDIHHENMITHGEYPVMIDLEALFHSNLEHKGLEDQKTAYDVALQSINDSVYSIGLLPMKLVNPYDKENGTVDISGFGGDEQQVSPFKVMMIQNKNTDDICLTKSSYVIEPQKNITKYNGAVVNANDYKEHIIKGFEDAYSYIMDHKEEIIIGFSRWFKDLNTRIIYRPTYIYTKLMFTSNHSDFMREKPNRYILLHRMGYKVKKQENEIVKSEIEDMMSGDVPFFEIDIHTGIMRNSKKEILPIEFKKTPFENVEQKIYAFNERDLNKQKLIIENAFLSKQIEDYRQSCMTNTRWSNDSNVVDHRSYIEMAESIGNKLLDDSYMSVYQGQKLLSWVNYTPIGDDQINYEYSPVAGDLYSGTSGIGLFLLYLWKATGKHQYLDAAYSCINDVICRMKEIDENSYYLIGPFNGLSGYIYVISKFYMVTKDTKMLDLVQDGLLRMKRIYFRDTNYDVISGSAGAIKVCLSLVKNFDNPIKDMADEMILLLTRHLIDHKTIMEDGGIAWKSGLRDQIYTGYAHGSAGIQDVLSEVYEKYNINELQDILSESDIFVKKMYIPRQKNWRTVLGKEKYAYAWCHGSPGIMYSRIKRLKGMSRFEKNNILNGMHNMKNYALGNNICYCHGDIGNIELIRRMALIIDDHELQHECECTYNRLASIIPEYIEQRPLLPYGLMLGISGIGYSLLAAISTEVPFILDLE